MSQEGTVRSDQLSLELAAVWEAREGSVGLTGVMASGMLLKDDWAEVAEGGSSSGRKVWRGRGRGRGGEVE